MFVDFYLQTTYSERLPGCRQILLHRIRRELVTEQADCEASRQWFVEILILYRDHWIDEFEELV